MSTIEISAASRALLQAFATLDERREVPTVHAAANIARLTFMESFDLVNELFSAGLLSHDLHVTDAGKKAAK